MVGREAETSSTDLTTHRGSASDHLVFFSPQELEIFLLQVGYYETRSALPAFVCRELRNYLSCGILEQGSTRFIA